MPLAIHGVVVKKQMVHASTLILVIKNLILYSALQIYCPHLGQEQMQKNAAKVIEGEALDLPHR